VPARASLIFIAMSHYSLMFEIIVFSPEDPGIL